MEDSRKQTRRRAAPVPEGRAERVGRLGSMLLGIVEETTREVFRRAAGRGESGRLLLSQANARRLTDALADLRGAAMKLGQMLSLQGDDLLPPEFVEILSSLRDQAYFMPEAQVRQVLTTELGEDWEQLFTSFDFEPLAAASIGQVHAGETPDGRDIALKVQYPGVRNSISSDVDNLAMLLRMSKLLPTEIDYKTLLPELKKELRREADYRREATSTRRYRKLVRDDAMVFVPRVHSDLSTRQVLATDRIYGLPIEDLRSPEHTQERRERAGQHLLRLVLRELFVFRFMQTDPNFANYLYEPKTERIALLDFGSVRDFEASFVEAYRQLVIAGVERDRRRIVEVAEQLGFIRQDTSPAARTGFAEICELFAEPLREPGPYDFASSDLAKRLREHAFEVFTHQRLPQPPIDAIFLHRKLVGGLLLCAHIGASVDCNSVYREWVLEAPGAG